MSGGGLDNVHRDMEDGDTDKARRNFEHAMKIIDDSIARIGDPGFFNGEWRNPTTSEQVVIRDALDGAKRDMYFFESVIDQASRAAKELAALFGVLDRIPSGDDTLVTLHELALNHPTTLRAP